LAILYKVEDVLSLKHSNSASSKTLKSPEVKFNVISHWLSPSDQAWISHFLQGEGEAGKWGGAG
jgi:hypothetical protein